MFNFKKIAQHGLIIFLIFTFLSSSTIFVLGQKLSDDLMLHSVGSWGVDLTDRDASVRPGDDFYMSQNGGWFSRTELSAQLPRSAYWLDLRTLSPRRLNAVLEEAAGNKNISSESLEGKAGAFYRAFMNERELEARGLTPLKSELDTIRAAKTKSQMAEIMGDEAGPGTPRLVNTWSGPSLGLGGVFSIDISQNQKETDHYAVYLGQSGLNLPGPEYYLDPKLADIKADYEAYVSKMLTLIGWPNAEQRAKEIVDLETRVAEVSWSHEQMRNVVATNNPMTVDELVKFAPEFDWRAFLKGSRLGAVNEVNVDAKDAFPKIAHIFSETPVEVWQARQAFSIADDGARIGYLNANAFNLAFDFRFRKFNSLVSNPPPRQRLVINAAALNIGGILSKIYVSRFSSPDVTAAVQEIAANLKKAFDARIQKLTWMSPETKAKAREKLERMIIKIGSPEKLQDFKGLDISDTDLYGDVRRAKQFDWQRRVQRLKGPFDRSEWTLTPEYPNYTYSAATNTVEIPAALLEPPFFDLRADRAVNYGAIGAQIGQMILSGFDDRGRHYDANGRLKDWWTTEESNKFDALRQEFSDRYSAFEPLPGIHVKGDLVVNEAIDDLGGLLIALDAYHLSLKGEQTASVLDGFTGDQRFFLGRAQMWRAKFDPTFVRNQLATGQNAQPFLRVNGPLPNIDAWYEAFNVGPNDKLYLKPERRVRIW